MSDIIMARYGDKAIFTAGSHDGEGWMMGHEVTFLLPHQDVQARLFREQAEEDGLNVSVSPGIP